MHSTEDIWYKSCFKLSNCVIAEMYKMRLYTLTENCDNLSVLIIC